MNAAEKLALLIEAYDKASAEAYAKGDFDAFHTLAGMAIAYRTAKSIMEG